MANAADLRVISQAATSVSQELAVIMDDVRTTPASSESICAFITFRQQVLDWKHYRRCQTLS